MLITDEFEQLDDWRELKRISIRTGIPNEEGQGLPHLRNFYTRGDRLFPLPSFRGEPIALRVFYYRRDEAPDGENDLENLWMKHFPDLYLAEVGLRLAEILEDASAQRYFAAMLERARVAYDDKVSEEVHATQVLTL